MAKLDVYLRSIERFGAAGAILTSGQAVMLRFPTGDRHATQVTPHDQLVGLVREVAPPAALDQIDKNRPARFEHDSNGTRYSVAIAPKMGSWQVAIEPVAQPAPVAAATIARAPAAVPAAPQSSEMTIERGQYDAPAAPQRAATSGSGFLDALTHAARNAHATDLYLGASAVPMRRIAGELEATGSAIDGDLLSRELGIVAPPEARAAWTEVGSAVFAYGDGGGRLRVTLGRDQRGPIAALRLLPDEPPALDQLNLDIDGWLAEPGLVVIAGASGSGKTVTLAAIVRALGERRRRVVAIEDPIELVHASQAISQRAVGTHVASTAAGVGAAMLEGADAIAIGASVSSEAASAIVDAIAGGHFVVMTIGGSRATAIERIVDLVPADRRTLARSIIDTALHGTIHAVAGPRGHSFEIVRARGRLT